jgi:hypothetical protein
VAESVIAFCRQGYLASGPSVARRIA